MVPDRGPSGECPQTVKHRRHGRPGTVLGLGEMMRDSAFRIANRGCITRVRRDRYRAALEPSYTTATANRVPSGKCPQTVRHRRHG